VSLGLSNRGESLNTLASLGKAFGLLERALSHLRGRSHENKLIALTALGFLDDPSTWSLIIPLAYSSNLSISIRSLETLVRLDSSQAVPFILELFPTRPDWPAHVVIDLLRSISPTLISEYVRQSLEKAPKKMVPRLIPILTLLPPRERSTILSNFLADSTSDDTLVACLKLVSQPKETPLARGLISHGTWQVRAEAATALGRAGNVLDKSLLEPLLCDPIWWVRYNSAKAIFQLPGIKSKALREIQMLHPDLFIQGSPSCC
jgi:HEAT repeat protein